MANHLVIIIMDSCRYDTFLRARTPNIDGLGSVKRCWSYASWTAPSHYAFLMGLTPHSSPQYVYASEVYKKDFLQWVDRLDLPDLSFKTFLPEISLPKVLKGLGYHCTARLSMPVLNNFTLLNRHFDDYRMMDNHNDFAGMVDEMQFPEDQLQFYFLNLGETHYPYMLKDANLPHISGVHGVFKGLSKNPDQEQAPDDGETLFDSKVMKTLHQQQVTCVEYIDSLVGRLLNKCPENTYLIITSDHGELFGEDGYFGHGPVMHEKCFEVPLVEGRRP